MINPKEIFKLLHKHKLNPGLYRKKHRHIPNCCTLYNDWYFVLTTFCLKIVVCDAMNVSCLFVLLASPASGGGRQYHLLYQSEATSADVQPIRRLQICFSITWWLLVSYLILGTRATQWRITVSISCHVRNRNTDSYHRNQKTKTSWMWQRESFHGFRLNHDGPPGQPSGSLAWLMSFLTDKEQAETDLVSSPGHPGHYLGDVMRIQPGPLSPWLPLLVTAGEIHWKWNTSLIKELPHSR